MRNKPCWPNSEVEPPEHVTQLMVAVVEHIGFKEYRIENGNVITYNLAKKVDKFFHKNQTKNVNSRHFHYKINPGASYGEQILTVNKMNGLVSIR